MGCPQCDSDEISPLGVCLICGYQVAQNPSETGPDTEIEIEKDTSVHPGAIEMDYFDGKTTEIEAGTVLGEAANEAAAKPVRPSDLFILGTPPNKPGGIPEWRQQLSRRLLEIKQRREAAPVARQEVKIPPPVAPPVNPPESLSDLQAKLLEKSTVRKHPLPSVPPPRQKTLEPLPPDAEIKPAAGTRSESSDAQEIRKMIDKAVLKQISHAATPASPAPRGPLPELPEPEMGADDSQEGKLILLSRTLSGLVDLIVVLLCTGLFVIAADFAVGIVGLDSVSLIVLGVLFLLIYFLYSLFFLSSSSQTIGMMMTDLRVVGENGRPSLGQLAGRCCAFLLSLLGLGIGLLLGLFHQDNRCFHDRFSGTYVARI
jgi:uncharacterized RDD family membrane protein YckC